MRFVYIVLFCAFRLGAQCTYTTLAGHAVTFAGDGVPVSQALFHKPGGISAGMDGSLYIADTGNNRIRKIDKAGVVRTIAGTGQPSFSGEGGPATAAALSGPTGMALASDGTLYFSDTQNNRVRAVRPDGTIATVAGNGQWKFAGDGGTATVASLNKPGSLALDGAGNLLIADSGNARVRRIDSRGIITTIAGSVTPDDYDVSVVPLVADTPALQYQLRYLSGVTTGPDGLIYITDQSAIWTLGSDGVMRPWLVFTPGGGTSAVTGSMLLSDLALSSAGLAVLQDGTQILSTVPGVLRVASGHVTLLSGAYLSVGVATDPSTGGVATLNYAPYSIIPFLAPNDPPLVIGRLGTDGSATAVYSYTPQSDPTVIAALNLTLTPTGALAIGPDGTVYFGDATPGSKIPFGRILALKTDGSIRLVTVTPQAPRSLAADSKGNLYFAQGSSNQIQKVPAAGGTPQLAYTSVYGSILALAIDGQDRLYLIGNSSLNPLSRIDPDGSQHSLYNSSFNPFGFDLQMAVSQATPLALAVSPDGTLYTGISAHFSNNPSQILSVSPAGTQGLLTVESSMEPAAMTAPSVLGTFISAGAEVWRILPDGTVVTVYGSDHKGFYGERGYDSEPGAANITGVALTGDGNLIVTDSNGGAIRRINTAACGLSPGPVIGGIAESALGNTALRRSAGELISIYGKRLGPAAGVVAAFDSSGHLATQLAGVSVVMNGIAAPLLYVSATQINAIVPFALEGQGTGTVTVRYNGGTSEDYSQAFGYYGPTVFNVSAAQGTQRLAVMQNQDGSLNTQTNAAKLGSIVTVYATGTGATLPAGEDGKQAGLPLKRTSQPVSIMVNGKAVNVPYAGVAPFLVEGTTQINFQIPADAPIGLAYFSISQGAGLAGYDNNILYFFYTGK